MGVGLDVGVRQTSPGVGVDDARFNVVGHCRVVVVTTATVGTMAVVVTVGRAVRVAKDSDVCAVDELFLGSTPEAFFTPVVVSTNAVP